MAYVVHVQHVVLPEVARGRHVQCWLMGPYRFRWVARLVAWAQHIDTPFVQQDGMVFEQGNEPPVNCARGAA